MRTIVYIGDVFIGPFGELKIVLEGWGSSFRPAPPPFPIGSIDTQRAVAKALLAMARSGLSVLEFWALDVHSGSCYQFGERQER